MSQRRDRMRIPPLNHLSACTQQSIVKQFVLRFSRVFFLSLSPCYLFFHLVKGYQDTCLSVVHSRAFSSHVHMLHETMDREARSSFLLSMLHMYNCTCIPCGWKNLQIAGPLTLWTGIYNFDHTLNRLPKGQRYCQYPVPPSPDIQCIWLCVYLCARVRPIATVGHAWQHPSWFFPTPNLSPQSAPLCPLFPLGWFARC